MAEDIQYQNPFVGLRAFEEEEDYLFFGRKAEINDLLKKFSSSRFLSVIGSSGSGKSSLVKSGLLPSLYSGFLSVGHNWRVAMIRPGTDPLGNLANELARNGVLYDRSNSEIPYEAIIESTLRRSSEGLSQVYKQARLQETDNLLIVIDQFEELFRFSKYEKISNQGVSDALNFINLLLNATKQSDSPIYVLLTMRSDFLGDCAQFRGLPEAINEGQYLVPRMTRDEVKEAIIGPIAIGGAQITQSLLTRLLNDVGNDFDQLPVLQHSMMRTWDAWLKRKQPETPISLDDYLKIGGMQSSLSQHANEIYDELFTPDGSKQKACELMFKALTDKAADVRGTRRPRSVLDLSKITQTSVPLVIEIVEAFRKPGRTLLMPPPHIPLEESSVIDISHESLMRVWDKLRHWTTEEVQDAELFKRLADAARREAKGDASLWGDPELTQALNWKASFNNNEELITVWAKTFELNTAQALDFLERSNQKAIALKQAEEEEELLKEKSIEAKRRSKRLTLIIIFLGILVVGSAISIVKVNHERNLAKEQEKKAREQEALANKNFKIANRNFDLANKNLEIANKEKENAKRLNIQLDSILGKTKKAKEEETKLKEKAQQQEAIAKDAKADAEKERNLSQIATIQNAGPKYQNLIRTLSVRKEKNPNLMNQQSADLLSYCEHLDMLRNGIEVPDSNNRNKNKKVYPSEINDAKIIAHELYDKLYYCLRYSPNKVDAKIPIGTANLDPKDNNYEWSKSDSAIQVNNGKVRIGNGGKSIQFKSPSSSQYKDSIFSKANIQAFVWNDRLGFIYSTDNNTLIIQNGTSLERIAMGGMITALDYVDGRLFFGLKTGQIGYIDMNDKNKQPIYRNAMGGRITTVEFFIYQETSYLFATNQQGRAAVFEFVGKPGSPNFNDNFGRNKKLNPIELPDYFGQITKARFSEKSKGLLLVIAKETYIWNPFVNDLREKLEKVVGSDLLKEAIENNKKY